MQRERALLFSFLLTVCHVARAGQGPQQAWLDDWKKLKNLPVTEKRFRTVCDLLQEIGRRDLGLCYRILSEYTPVVRASGNREWVHVLLMGWAKARESLDYFPEADTLYREARGNADSSHNHRLIDEALVGTILLYAEWGRTDSVAKYAAIGEAVAGKAGDRENLSFIHTFRGVSRPSDTAAMGKDLRQAILLADGLSDKNALFTAKYNYAVLYWQQDPVQQVAELDSLLGLITDHSLDHKPKLYERTAFTFRNPGPSIYYQLMQVNLLLRDYENAGRYAGLFYDAAVRPDPGGVQAPYFNAEMAIVKSYQQDWRQAVYYLRQSRKLFAMSENDIPYPSYFQAKGMLAEHEGRIGEAVHAYEAAWRKGTTEGLHFVPSGIYYAHGLTLDHRLDEASKVLEGMRKDLPARTYSAYGYYYYRVFADLMRAEHDYPGYARALDSFYAIKDSLTSLNHYRAIQEIEARFRVRDKERQIADLNRERVARERNTREERIYLGIFLAFSIVVVLLFILKKAKQHRIEVMQRAMEAEEGERRKIADRLHDEVGSMLSLATLQISSTIEKGRSDPEAGKRLDTAQVILGSVAAAIRDLSHRLTPMVIEKYGLRKAIGDMLDAVNQTGTIRARAVIVGFDDTQASPPVLLQEIYRILQELMHNILKHAQASEAVLELVEHPGVVSIMVEDNGLGIAETPETKGRGLRSIRSKIAYFKGQMEVSRKPDGGTLIVIELPTGHWQKKG